MAEGEYDTQRGFHGYAEINDTYGARVRVQDSSAATRTCVWIFVEGGAVDGNNGSAHLTQRQAIVVRDALTEFIDAWELDSEDDEDEF